MSSFFKNKPARTGGILENRSAKPAPIKRKVVNKTRHTDVRGHPTKKQKIKPIIGEDVWKENEEDNEDILSDEVDGYSEEEDDSESDIEETEQQKRLRLAKDYISQVEANLEENAGQDTDELIAERLELDYKKTIGAHYESKAATFTTTDDITLLRGHKLSATCVVLSPDDRYIYSASKDCNIIKWDMQTKRKVNMISRLRKETRKGKPQGHYKQITSIAISDSNKFLASGDLAGLIVIWNPDSLEYLYTFTGHKSAVYALAFRLGSHSLYSGAMDRMVKVWTCDEMSYVETLFGHQDGIQSIDATMKERALTVGGRDNSARVWKIPEESQLVFQGPGGCSLDCVSFLDEYRFITGSDTNQLCVWATSKKKAIGKESKCHQAAPNGECWITSVRALRNSDIAASGANDGLIRFWNVAKDKSQPVRIFEVPMCGFVNDLQFSSTGEYVIAAVGQEHKHGRWWRIPEARNGVAIIKLGRKDPSEPRKKKKVKQAGGDAIGEDETGELPTLDENSETEMVY